MDGEAGQGDAVVSLAGAGGEGNIESLGRNLGVVEEGFVKITYLEEHQGVAVPVLEVQVLLQHGGDFVRGWGGHDA